MSRITKGMEGKFFRIPKSIFDDWESLDPIAKSALMAINMLTWSGKRDVIISNKSLLKIIGVKDRALEKHMKSLEDFPYVSRHLVSVGNGHSMYTYSFKEVESKDSIFIKNDLVLNKEWADMGCKAQVLYLYKRLWSVNSCETQWSTYEGTLEHKEEYLNRKEFKCESKVKDSIRYKQCGIKKSSYIRATKMLHEKELLSRDEFGEILQSDFDEWL
tara:strand:+ start:223 stop:870 length:648 start_codon:yes stop_codon:yes gene_type:complete